jgi:hypothetical protein
MMIQVSMATGPLRAPWVHTLHFLVINHPLQRLDRMHLIGAQPSTAHGAFTLAAKALGYARLTKQMPAVVGVHDILDDTITNGTLQIHFYEFRCIEKDFGIVQVTCFVLDAGRLLLLVITRRHLLTLRLCPGSQRQHPQGCSRLGFSHYFFLFSFSWRAGVCFLFFRFFVLAAIFFSGPTPSCGHRLRRVQFPCFSVI